MLASEAMVWAPGWWASWMASTPASRRSSARTPRPPSGATDDFVERLLRRDEAALGEFFERFSRRVERLLLRVLGADPDLSDVVQDSFEQALLSLHRFEGNTAQLGAWLNRIAINVAKNRLRHQRVRGWLRGAVPYENSEVAARVASPEVADAMRRTYEVLQRLPVPERTVFALRFIDGMQLTEIAEVTEVSLATVKRQLRKARTRFERNARRDPILLAWFPGGER